MSMEMNPILQATDRLTKSIIIYEENVRVLKTGTALG